MVRVSVHCNALKLYDCQAYKQSVQTPGICDCDVLKPFWLSWTDGLIRVGRGNNIGDQVVVEWLDTEPLGITFAAITGWNQLGIWEFSLLKGKTYTMTPYKVCSNISCLFLT